MHTNHPIDHEAQAHAEELGYEPRDISPFVMGKSVIILSVIFVLCVFAGYGTIQLLTWAQGIPDPRHHVVPDRPELPGGPLVQSNITAKKDMAELRAKEIERVNGYKSIPGTDNVSIPLDEALKKVAEQGSIR